MTAQFKARCVLWGVILALAGALLTVTGCQEQQPTPTPTPGPTVTPAPSPTPAGQPFTPISERRPD